MNITDPTTPINRRNKYKHFLATTILCLKMKLNTQIWKYSTYLTLFKNISNDFIAKQLNIKKKSFNAYTLIKCQKIPLGDLNKNRALEMKNSTSWLLQIKKSKEVPFLRPLLPRATHAIPWHLGDLFYLISFSLICNSKYCTGTNLK